MASLRETILAALARSLQAMSIALTNLSMEPRMQLYQTALTCLGSDASPNDVAPDELACAETVCDIYLLAFDRQIKGTSPIVSTALLYEALLRSPGFSQTNEPAPGDIVISPTGKGASQAIPHGHTGIVGINGTIMSNDSRSGKFEQNYTIDGWRRHYVVQGGYPMLFFRPILP